MKHLMFAENTFTGIHEDNTGSRVDFRELKGCFEEADKALFFFQKNKTVSWSDYEHLIEVFQNCGWEVSRCVDQSIETLRYTPQMESAALIADAMFEAMKIDYIQEEVVFTFCINSLNYVPFIEKLCEQCPWIELRLVCDPETANEDLKRLFDEVVSMYELPIAYEGGTKQPA